MKRAIIKSTAWLLIFILLLGAAPFNMSVVAEDGVWDGSVASGFASGTGTGADPYIIETPEQLAYFAQSVNSGNYYSDKVIRLANDIVLNSPDVFEYDTEGNITGKAEGAVPNVWTAIGTSSKGFSGTFYGDGHSVSGIYVDTTQYHQGLFGYLKWGTIKNLIVCDFYVKGGNMYVGGLAGRADYSKICNCISNGTVVGIINCGGIAGYNVKGVISDCRNEGLVTAKSTAGGIVGYNFTGTVIGCVNNGSVTGEGGLGGIAGNGRTVVMCLNTGSVEGSKSTVGGVIGTGGLVSDCCNTGSVCGTSYVGGVAGNCESISNNCSTGIVEGNGDHIGGVYGGATFGKNKHNYYLEGSVVNGTQSDYPERSEALTENEMRNPNSFKDWDFDNVWTINRIDGYEYPRLIKLLDVSLGGDSAVWDGKASNGFASGNGTQNDPYIIETANQLAFLASSVNSGNTYADKYIELAADIILNDTDAAYWTLNAVMWTVIGDEHYNPISIPNETAFNDAMKTYGALYTEGSSDYFSWIIYNQGYSTYYYRSQFSGTFGGGGHTVSGVYVEGVNDQGLFGYICKGTVRDVSVDDSFIVGSYDVGSVAGYIDGGTIMNCRIFGSVKGMNSVGGVAGYNDRGTISGCNFQGSVKGHQYTGGLTGYGEYGTVRSSRNAGNVSGIEFAAGVTGYNDNATIINSCNTGDVSAFDNVGGLTSYNYGVVDNSYSTGGMDGDYRVGGVIAYNGSGGTTKNCFYLSGSAPCGISDSDYPGTVEELTHDEMQEENSFNGWDFQNVWTIDTSNGYEYPQHIKLLDRSFGETSAIWNGIASEFGGGTGEETDAYIIRTAEQLAYLASSVNNGESFSGQYFKLESDIILNNHSAKYWMLNACEWKPIGTALNSFQGIFDGGGHTVSGLYADGSNYLGLFGYVSDGTVKNTIVADSYIEGSNSVGGIVGYISGTVDNCTNNSTVTGTRNIGGVAGESRGTVNGCLNTGVVIGSNNVGGLTGGNYGTVSGCINTNGVSGSYYIGGITGDNIASGVVSDCFSSGNVAGTDCVGGVVGNSQLLCTVINCKNTGNVTGADTTGGIVGNNIGTVYGIENAGTVTGVEYVGGIAGGNAGIICIGFNAGNVSSIGEFSYAGGISGYMSKGTVSMCRNSGTISGSSNVGGLAGIIFGEIINSYNTGAVTGEKNAGGIAGCVRGAISNCYSVGNISGGIKVGGVGGMNTSEGSVSSCYYLTDTLTGVISGVEGIELTDNQMKQNTSFINWDFSNIWTMDGSPDFLYPELIDSNDVSLTFISLSAERLSLFVGDTQQLTAVLLPSNADNKAVTWSSSNESIAKVDSEGVVTALAAGTVKITVTAADTTNGVISDNCTVTVAEVRLTGIEIKSAPDKTVYYVGDALDTTGLTLTATYNNGKTQMVSDSFICTPTTLNIVGKQTITVSYDGKSCTFDVEINRIGAVLLDIAAIPDKPYTGRSITPELTVTFNGTTLVEGTDYSVEYSNNRAVGTATVTITGIGNFRGTKTVTFKIVAVPVSDISLSKRTLSLNYKDTFALKVTVDPINATNKKVTWKSSDISVAEVDQNGRVTAKRSGTASITATSDDGGLTASCAVTVKYAWWQQMLRIMLFGWIWY